MYWQKRNIILTTMFPFIYDQLNSRIVLFAFEDLFVPSRRSFTITKNKVLLPLHVPPPLRTTISCTWTCWSWRCRATPQRRRCRSVWRERWQLPSPPTPRSSSPRDACSLRRTTATLLRGQTSTRVFRKKNPVGATDDPLVLVLGPTCSRSLSWSYCVCFVIVCCRSTRSTRSCWRSWAERREEQRTGRFNQISVSWIVFCSNAFILKGNSFISVLMILSIES